MRVVFLGGKDVGCGCLEALLDCPGIEVAAVIVNPSDVEQSRWYGSATRVALARGVPIRCYTDVNAPEAIERISEFHPELMVVVYFDQILRRPLLDLVPAVNLHLALAEEYRGCYPSTWALINGETQTGVTLHYVDEGMDTGDIIAQTLVSIAKEDTGKSLYDKLTRAGIKLFKEALPGLIDGTAPRRVQRMSDRTRTYHRRFPSQQIDWTKSGEEILNQIRALYFPPFPLPYFHLNGTKFVVVEESMLCQR